MQAQMEVLHGAKTKEMQLRLPTVIGRGGDASVKLPASTVSRHHCELYEYEGQIVVRDLGSSNGTIVNGHKIKGPTFLTPEDELTIGPVTVRLRQLAETTATQPDSAAAAAEEVAPSFDDLPVEQQQPVDAARADDQADSALAEPAGQAADDDSILQYAESESTGRSFIGITPADDAPESVSEVPVFDGLDQEKRPEIKPDDSALHSFFDNLDRDG